MSKHTPGPWGFTYDGSSDWSIGEADDPQDKKIAGVWERHRDRDESRANIQLIAAAPDLLEALKSVLAVADRKTKEFDAARAAIAKATVQDSAKGDKNG